LWKKVAKSDSQSDDLIETTSYLVHTFTRRPVVEAIIAILKPLKPTGGLLALPTFGWKKLFTTNFDRLIERAYAQAGVPLTPIRSNYDFTAREASTDTRLFKIHGCISQDESLGSKASMTLTEDDYAHYSKYRQALFADLQSSLLGGDVLVIGQSLRDRHLLELIQQVHAAHLEGAPGKVFALIYDKDDIRAPLLESKGVRIAFGGLDEFAHILATTAKAAMELPARDNDAVLPASLVSTVFDASLQGALKANTTRMYNGGPGTYADIASGATFERARHTELENQLTDGKVVVVAITGAAGVGKTTFARQLLSSLCDRMYAWEHRPEFTFDSKAWKEVEARLRADRRQGLLLLDECTHYLRQTNELVDALAAIENPALRLVLTANSAQWAPRIKSANIFSRGATVELSRLTDSEITSLLRLVGSNREVAALVDPQFKRQTPAEQFRALRQKSSADMFVCLKNIFANESLDTILLAEYDALEEQLQEYYRYVAALEAVGMKVHRQLVIRMLHLPTDRVRTILDGLTGIVDEYDIKPAEGIYGWSTRHVVIARRITNYKFSSLPDVIALFNDIIDGLNPAAPIELQSVREICDQEHGIGRIPESEERQRLYRRLIELAPGERVPWHRLIRELLNEGSLEPTEYVLRDAREAVGSDAPIDRYAVRLLMLRAEKTQGISRHDRIAILRHAYELALTNIARHKIDKLGYYTLCDVAVELVARGENKYVLSDAIETLKTGAEKILDPDIPRRIRDYEQILDRVG
jgi:hypothetical protein